MKAIDYIRLVMTPILVVAMTTGCATHKESTNHTVSMEGSSSMERVVGYLSEVYMEEHSNVKVTYSPTGSSAGIQAVLEGRCDIGLSSRKLNDDESQSLESTVVAIDGIAIVVHPDNPISDLSMELLADVYTGAITDWSQLGGEASPIVCIGRESASGTRDGFESITGTVDACKYTQELTSTGDVVQTVLSNPNAIGYASLGSVGDSVKVLSIDGVVPSNDTILDGTYAVSRDYTLVTLKGKELTGAVKGFYDFAMSTSADEYIVKAGAVPVGK